MSDKTAVFYFNFSLNDDTERNCGFIFNPSLLSEDYIDDQLYDDITCDFEEQFGVHDWSSLPAGIPAIGYTSYEVTNVDDCMDAWHNKIAEIVGETNVSKWVDFEPQYLETNDLEIRDRIMSLV
jgi:hypothetical protein